MADEQVPYLEEWCREFPAGATAESRTVRSAAISKSAGELVKELDGLLRLAFDLIVPQRAESKIREALNAADPSFAMVGNGRELKVMAGAVLAELVRRQNKQSPQVAAAVETASFGGLRQANLPVDLVGYCSRRLIEIAANNRKRLAVKWSPAVPPAIEFKDVPNDQLTSQTVNAAIRAAATSAASSATAGMQSLVSQAALIRNVTVLEEELQILWWLTNQWSYAAEKDFPAVPTIERPFYFADDLAGRSEIFPAGANIRSLLKRADLGNQELEVIAAVNSMDRTWAKSRITGLELSPITAPLHVALQRRLETTDDNGWSQGWSSITTVATNSRMNPVALGLQFFREAFLLKNQ